MKRLLLLSVPVLLLALAGCGSSSKSSPSSTSTATAAPATSSSASSTPTGGAAPTGGKLPVSMKNLAYSPATLQAKVGDAIVWTNNDTPPHNVTYVSGPKFTSSSTMNPGATFSIKVTQPGTIHYFCTIHPFMKGTVIVTK